MRLALTRTALVEMRARGVPVHLLPQLMADTMLTVIMAAAPDGDEHRQVAEILGRIRLGLPGYVEEKDEIAAQFAALLKEGE